MLSFKCTRQLIFITIGYNVIMVVNIYILFSITYRSWFDGHQQLNRLQHFRHSAVPWPALADQGFLLSSHTGHAFCWHQLSWTWVLCHFPSVHTAYAVCRVFAEQIQIRSKSGQRLPPDVRRIPDSGQFNRAERVLPRK